MSDTDIAIPVRGDFIGSDRCHAEGHTVRGSSPVLMLCRKLVEAGFDPNRSLCVYRGDTLCLTARSIGETARLSINSKGTGFIRCRRAVRAAPPKGQGQFSQPPGVAPGITGSGSGL